MIYELKVENIKCSGCAQTIKNGLNEVKGVTTTEVDIPNGIVRVGTIDDLPTETILEKLKSLGYPERVKGSGHISAT